jgi:hypothetical protein
MFKYFIYLFAFLTFSSAHAAGEVVSNCSPYGPNGNGTISPGWGISSMRFDMSCGIYQTRFNWINMNGYPYGAKVQVCNINEQLQNWWPVSYITNNPRVGPCYSGGAYYYIVEYRGN